MKNILAVLLITLLLHSVATAQVPATTTQDTIPRRQDKRLEVTTKDKEAIDSLRRRLADDSTAVRLRRAVSESLRRQWEIQRTIDTAVGKTPQGTVIAYFRRLNDGDLAGARALTMEDSTVRGTMLLSQLPAKDQSTYTVIKTDVQGTVAEVSVLCESSSSSVLPVTIVVRCEWLQMETHGEWRIATTQQLYRQNQ